MTILSRIKDLLKSGTHRKGNISPEIKPEVSNIALETTDAIVNAADWTLCGGTGVDGAIHEMAGEELGKYIHGKKARLTEAGVFVSPGFKCNAKFILHTCAPVYDVMNEDDGYEILKQCYINVLSKADELHLNSISFPLLGGGAFGWATPLAAKAMMDGIREYGKTDCVKEIKLLFRTNASLSVFEKVSGIKGKKGIDGVYHSGKNGMSFLDNESNQKTP